MTSNTSVRDLSQMRNFLLGHFRYGKNDAYACNIKVSNLPYDTDYYNALGNQSLMNQVFETLEKFSANYRHLGCYTDGRSGGYIVLHARRQQSSGHKSFCTCCGQQNFRLAADLGSLDLYEGHPAWPMALEMIKLTGMSAGHPLQQADYFAWWARNHGSCAWSYFELFTLAEKLMPKIVGKGAIIKCGRCGSSAMRNFKEPPFHWVPSCAINDTKDDIMAMEDDDLIERYNLIKAFDLAAQDLIAEFQFLAKHWEEDNDDECKLEHTIAQEGIIHHV